MIERTVTGVYAMTTYEYDDAGSTPPTVAGGGTYIGCFHDEKKDRVFTVARDASNPSLTPDVSVRRSALLKRCIPMHPVYFF